jgi:toxin ParE1/3/4
MNRFRISPCARDDLDQAWDYIAVDNPMAATKWLAELSKKFALLSRNPLLCEECRQLGGDLRRLSAGSYVVFYRVQSSGIEIVRVIHGARDIDFLFRDE